jgi:hypothetical protein
VKQFTDDQSSCCWLLRLEKSPAEAGLQLNSGGVGNERRRQLYPKYLTSQGKAGTSEMGQTHALRQNTSATLFPWSNRRDRLH